MNETVARLAVAALAGLAVGLEREWSGHATGPLARFAGLRTFLLIGSLGGVSGWLVGTGAETAAAVLLAGGAALIVAAYVLAARPGGHTIEGTTEVAALLVLALGVLAGLGFLELVSGATAVMVLALSEKERLRELVSRIGTGELRAALQFAVLALVVLPLLPAGSYGPLGGMQPRGLWVVVLLFSGLNFAGVWKAPVVFLCQNNGWAISCPIEEQTASDGFAIKGEAYGVPGVVVDGNDLLAVRKATSEAVERARRRRELLAALGLDHLLDQRIDRGI